MKIAALTGLSKESINDLVKRGIRTFEIRSTHNLIIFSDIKPGELVFITDAVPPDVVPGLCGHIASVKGVDIHMNRVTFETPLNYEERETMAGRVQLILHSVGKVKEVLPVTPYKPIYVNALEIKSCEAR